jgi:zinc transport system substrate-binding protein
MTRWWQCALTVAVLGLGLGCDSRSANAPAQVAGRKVVVLASVYPMAEMASRIGGAHVEVQWLAEGGQRPEEIANTAPDLKQRANRAEVVITSGPWDGWAMAELSPEVREARLVEPGRMEASRRADARSYLWLDPAVVREMVAATKSRMTIADTNHEAEYRQGAQGYLDEVNAVDREFRDGLASLKGRSVVAVRPVWGAMCARYGLELRTPVVATEKEPPVTDERLKPADFKEIARVAKSVGAAAIVVDVSSPVAVRQQIEERTGLRAVTLDALGTSAADGRNTWAKVMRYNLAQLKRGLE